MDLRKLVEKVPHLQVLRDLGEGWIVGGTVRDFLLGKDPEDFDLTFRGDVRELALELRKRVRGRVVLIGKELQEVRYVLGPRSWLDLSPLRGEHIEKDLYKRDFTINAMAVPLRGEPVLIDPLRGREDLEQGILRTPRLANLRDDPVRILRAFRFLSTLGFELEPRTLRGIRRYRDLLLESAPERIRYELFKLFMGDQVYRALKAMVETGVLFVLFPELLPLKRTAQVYYHRLNLLHHTLEVVRNLEALLKNPEASPFAPYLHRFRDILEDPKRRALLLMGALFHDIGKPDTLTTDEEGNTHFHGHERVGAKIVEKIGRRLRFSNEEIEALHALVRHHMHPHLLAKEPEITPRAVNRYLRKTGEWAWGLVILAYADAKATPPIKGKGIYRHPLLAQKMEEVLRNREKAPAPRLVTGYDLIDLGLKPGPIFKVILQEIEDLQAEGVIRTREEALEKLREIVEKWLPQATRSTRSGS